MGVERNLDRTINSFSGFSTKDVNKLWIKSTSPHYLPHFFTPDTEMLKKWADITR